MPQTQKAHTGHGKNRNASTGTKPMPSVSQETETAEVWPGPNSNVEQFINQYSDSVDQRLFHVDYLVNTFRDFARPNMYKVEFFYNKAFEQNFSFLSDTARTMTEMTAKTVNFPSFDIGKQEIRRCGERIFLPTTQNYADLQMTMMCDDNYTQRKFLHSWMKHIVYDTDYNYYHKVKNMLGCNIIVRQFDNNYNTTFAAEFIGAWPNVVGEIQLSQDSDSQVVEFPVTFCYSMYKILSNSAD